jgi:hypothetical protein
MSLLFCIEKEVQIIYGREYIVYMCELYQQLARVNFVAIGCHT